MVIGFAAQDGHGTVELLDKDEAYHLVGKGHRRKRNLLLGGRVDGLAEAVGPAYHKHQALRHLEKSDFMAEVMGEHVFEFFLRSKWDEWHAYQLQITSFELRHNLNY